MAYVYRHIRKDKNQVFYIGIGNTPGLHRAKSKSSRNKIWNNIVKNTDYDIEILFEDIDWDFAVKKEIELISMYGKIIDNTGTLCNITNGGEGCSGFNHSDEFKNKLKEERVGFKNPMYGMKGDKSPNFGVKRSEETKKKIRESHKGKFNNDKNPFYGKKHSEESKIKMSEYHNKNSKKGVDNKMSVKIINSKNGKIYNCIREAAEDFSFTYNKVKCLLNGKTKTNITGLMYYSDYIKKEGN